MTDIHEEHRALKSQFGQQQVRCLTPPEMGGPATAASTGGGSSTSTSSVLRLRKGPIGHRPAMSKRISVPDNFTYFPPPSSTGGAGTTTDQFSKANVALQQQLMHQRLIHKRHHHTVGRAAAATTAAALAEMSPAAVAAAATTVSRHRSGSWSSRSTRQHHASLNHKPYLPQEASATTDGHLLFHPIAEDETGLDDPGLDADPSQVESIIIGPSTTSASWQTLPNYMEETCRLGAASPPAPEEPDPSLEANLESTDSEMRRTSTSSGASDKMDTISPT